MAIINSMGVGRSRKSMGNVTYRTVRGRTIGSQKRSGGSVTTRGIGGNIRKPLFAMISMFMREHASDIQVSFNKTRYGSQRNYMFKKNYSALSSALSSLALAASASGTIPNLTEIEAAITEYATANPTSIYRVLLDGFATVYLTGAWNEEDNPVSGGASDGLGTGTSSVSSTDGKSTYTAPIALSLSFHAGARTVRSAGNVTILAGVLPSGITAANIVYLGTSGVAIEPQPAITDVVSAAGSLKYTCAEITEAMGVIGFRMGNIFVRLSSAYVRTGSGLDENPLG